MAELFYGYKRIIHVYPDSSLILITIYSINIMLLQYIIHITSCLDKHG